MKLYNGDMFDILPTIQDNSAQMIFADFPYGITRNKWDVPFDYATIWKHFLRVKKSNGVIILTAAGLFAAKIKLHDPELYKYSWIWHKNKATGFLNAKHQPLRDYEEIVVFYDKTKYYPQKTYGHTRKVTTAEQKQKGIQTPNYNKHGAVTYDSTERYPKTVLSIPVVNNDDKARIHPTQKPVELMEYLIRTYTDKDDLVIDPVMGSGTTGIACINTSRNFVGIEKDKNIFAAAINRIEKHV